MNRSSFSAEAADPWRTAFRASLPGRLRSLRWPLLAALLLAAVTLGDAAVAPGVSAQSMDPVLVSNTGQADGTSLTTTAELDSFAQSFRTGGNVNGYSLSSVELGLSAAAGVEVEVSLWATGRAGIDIPGDRFILGSARYQHPQRRVVTLTGPASIDADTSTLERFTTNGDVLLLHDTTYWIVVTKTAGADGGLSIGAASSPGAVDSGGLDGFSLGGRVWARAMAGDPWNDDEDRANGSDTSIKVRLSGAEAGSRPPGPYVTNRYHQTWAAPARTSTSASKYATSFEIYSGGFGSQNITVTSVQLSVAAEAGVTPRVAIHEDDNGSPADTPLAIGSPPDTPLVIIGTLTTPSDISRDLASPARAEFTAGTPLTLNTGTTYWVVLDVASGSGDLSVSTTASDDVDGEYLWKVAVQVLHSASIGATMQAYRGATWSDDSGGRSFRMAVNGTTDLAFLENLFIGPPQVGVGLAPTIEDSSGWVHNESWQWQRGDTSEGPFTDIPAAAGGASGVYTPVAADIGKWLKATVTYDDAYGSGRSLSAVSLQPVLPGATISNAGQFQVLGYIQESVDSDTLSMAQAFTTGPEALGYVLNGVRLGFGLITRSPYYSDTPSPGDSTTTPTGGGSGLTVSFGASAYTVDESDDESTDEIEENRVTVTVELSAAPGDGDTVDIPVTVTNRDGASGEDYSGVPDSVTFAAGETSKSFVIEATDDMEDDDGESVELGFGMLPPGLSPGVTSTATVSIRDDDAIIDALSWALHADAGGVPARTPLFESIDIPAADVDPDQFIFEELVHPGFILQPNTRYWVVISSTLLVEAPAGEGPLLNLAAVTEHSQPVFLYEGPVALDEGSEPGWSLDVPALTSLTGWIAPDWRTHANVLELEGRSVLRMSVIANPVVDVSFAESSYTVAEADDTATPNVEENKTTVTVTLSEDPKRKVTIPITPTHRDGSTPADYSGVPSSVTFGPGETRQTFEVMAVQDGLHEDDEHVDLSFGTLPPGVNPGTPATATLSITGPPVTVGFGASSYTVTESDDTETMDTVENQVVVTVTLNEDPERDVTVPIKPANQGGATDADYSVVPDELVFAEGETSKTFTFTAAHDTEDDDDETVELSFGTLPPGVGPGANPTAIVSITDDDDPIVTVSFGASTYTVAESDNTATPQAENEVTVTVTLSADPERSITIPINRTNQGGATDADYSGVPDKVTFATGQTVRTFTITAAHDTADDDDESVKLTFGTMPDDRVSPASPSETVVSITDDDDPFVTVRFGASSYTVAESDDTETTAIEENKTTVTVTLSADPERTVTIPITPTNQDGATTADYSGVPDEVTFTSGETTRTFTFTATNDTEDDDDESVKLAFGAMPDPRVSPASPSETTVSITDDDDPHVTVSFDASSYSVEESDNTETTGIEEHKTTVTVTLSADPERSLTISITPTNLGDATDADYSGVPDEVIFARGETSKTFTFTATDDATYERGESVELSFGVLPPRVTAGANGTATVWITDDDPRPVTVSFGESAYGVGEGNSVVVAVELNADPERKVTVTITRTNQNGATDADYSGVPDEVVFNTGETRKLFTVTATDDDEAEEGETVELGFGTLEEAVSEGAPATTTITLSDSPCPYVIWCGTVTLQYASGSGADDQRRRLTRTRTSLTELLETDVFKRNGEDYLFVGPTTLKQGPSGSGTASPPYHIPELGEMLVSLQNVNGGGATSPTVKHTYNVMPNDDWKDWTLKISAVIEGETTEIELPFSDARLVGTNIWIWFGRDLHDLATSWTPAQKYEIRVVSDPRSDREASPPGPPLYARTEAVAASHAVVSWVRPQLRDDSVPDGVTYKVQWKLETTSWHAPNAVSEHVYTPEDGKGSLSWTLHGLAPDTVYQLRVIATTDNGDSEPSNVWTFRTMPGPPPSDRKFSVGILGAGSVGETLTATVRAVREDVDLDDYSRTHQWLRFNPVTSKPVAIAGATASTYVVRADDEGRAVYVQVTFTGTDNAQETVTSVGLHIGSGSGDDDPTAQQEAANSPPTGEPAITGTGQVGETLTADTSGIRDEDGLANPGYTYQWIRSDLGADTGTDIDGETSRTYVVTTGDVDHALKVRVSFTDDAGQQHSLTSTVAIAIPPPPVTVPDEEEPETAEQEAENSPATGEPYITGEPGIGATLIADIFDIADEDGLASADFSYQWLRRDLATQADTAIDGETGETYTVTAADEGKALRVRVSFTDDAGNEESLTSEPTDAVPAPPDPGPGLSDLDPGAGQQLLAAALVRVGDRGRKNDDSQDRAWYATDTSAWHASGEMLDGSLAWNDMTLTRVVYFADTGVLRLNEADPVHLGESFAAGGVNRDLTIWIKTETATVSFLARDHIASSGSSFINFHVPDDARATLAAIAKDDLVIIAVSAPDTS